LIKIAEISSTVPILLLGSGEIRAVLASCQTTMIFQGNLSVVANLVSFVYNTLFPPDEIWFLSILAFFAMTILFDNLILIAIICSTVSIISLWSCGPELMTTTKTASQMHVTTRLKLSKLMELVTAALKDTSQMSIWLIATRLAYSALASKLELEMSVSHALSTQDHKEIMLTVLQIIAIKIKLSKRMVIAKNARMDKNQISSGGKSVL
jgi:hypothetical protein